MNLCIPIAADLGLQSSVCAHFGSAPAFMIVDTRTERCRAIPNRNQHRAHGMCIPLATLEGERVEGAVVSGIGMGALQKLNASNIIVYVSDHATVADTVAAWKAGALRLMLPRMACGHRGHGQG